MANPANSAMPYLNQIPDVLKQYFTPYVNSGSNALGTLMGEYNTLLTNPGSVMSMAGSGFKESPGYEYQYNQGMNAANSAAAAGGYLGTPGHQEQASTMSEDIANQDYYNYLNHALGLYDTGLSGEQGINQMGFGASTDLANSLANNLMTQGSLAFKGTAEQNQSNADLWNTIIKLASGLGTAGLLAYKGS